MSSSSKESFVDASGDGLLPADVIKDDEAPLSTPTKNDKKLSPQPEEQHFRSTKTVTIFDVATEIETMLQNINKEIDDNDALLKTKFDKITKKLDQIESKTKT